MENLDLERWEEVNSSHIHAVGVRDDFLVVQFKNGTIYRYPGMSDHYDDLLSAESVGKYFHKNVREQLCEKIRDDEWPEEL